MSRIDWPDDETLREWYEDEGMSYREISDRLCCSRSAVGKRIRAMDDVDTPGQDKFVDWPDDGTLELWHHHEGLSRSDIADRLGTYVGTVTRHFERRGIKCRRHDGRIDWPDDQTLRDWYESGDTTHDIADRIGCAHSSAYRRLVNIGVDLRPQERFSGGPERVDWPDDLPRLWDDADTFTELADDIGCTPTALRSKLEREGLDVPPGQTKIGRKLGEDDRKLLRYTRWAIGEYQREFAQRLGVPVATYSSWESGRNSPNTEHAEVWERIERLARGRGVDPDEPRRHLYWREFKRLLEDLLVERDASREGLSREMGLASTLVGAWLREDSRPSVKSHKIVREFAELHGVWSPPSPVESPKSESEPEPSEGDISETDRETIRQLAESKSISEIAMMYDLHLSTVSGIIRES